MNYKTLEWKINGWIYDPYDKKPDWLIKRIETGQAYEYRKDDLWWIEFGDKRSTHKAFTGDLIYYDQFGRFDVWSGKHLSERVEKKTELENREMDGTHE